MILAILEQSMRSWQVLNGDMLGIESRIIFLNQYY